MPHIKDYKGKQNNPSSSKRRPRDEMGEPQEDLAGASEQIEVAENEEKVDVASSDRVHLQFYGSDLIRMKAPKVMEVADIVADEWVKDGQFQGLPVGNPLAQMAAAKALRTAKDVEKKLDEKGVFVMAKMGFDYLKSKIEKK